LGYSSGVVKSSSSSSGSVVVKSSSLAQSSFPPIAAAVVSVKSVCRTQLEKGELWTTRLLLAAVAPCHPCRQVRHRDRLGRWVPHTRRLARGLPGKRRGATAAHQHV
jgi:hypothetical protein